MERKNQIFEAGQKYLDSMDEFQRYHTYPREAFIDGAKCTIGLWSDYDYSPLVTLSDLVEMQPDSIYTMTMLTDNRYNTCLTRFTHCPWCGKKIDWETIRNNYKDK